jgi:predicted dehydrogenase
MFRIGIIGSDNSHADAFSQLINLKNPKTGEFDYPDCKVTGIFGLEKERTEEVAKNGEIEFIASTPEELVGRVDAVMIVFRHGDLHAKYAMPFIKLGIPVWLDKPFTIKNSDARDLIDAAKRHNTILTGGSTCKFAYDILMLKNLVENGGGRLGNIKSAMLNFPATLENDYGGIYFYGAHLTEMCCAVFGYDMKSVIAHRLNKDVLAIVKYDKYQVALSFIDGSSRNCAYVVGDKDVILRDLDISLVYRHGLDEFIKTLRTGKIPVSHEKLYATVELLNAIKESYESGREISLKGM